MDSCWETGIDDEGFFFAQCESGLTDGRPGWSCPPLASPGFLVSRIVLCVFLLIWCSSAGSVIRELLVKGERRVRLATSYKSLLFCVVVEACRFVMMIRLGVLFGLMKNLL